MSQLQATIDTYQTTTMDSSEEVVPMVVARVPTEIVQRIFSFCELRDLVNIKQTCKLWYQLSRDGVFWKWMTFMNFQDVKDLVSVDFVKRRLQRCSSLVSLRIHLLDEDIVRSIALASPQLKELDVNTASLDLNDGLVRLVSDLLQNLEVLSLTGPRADWNNAGVAPGVLAQLIEVKKHKLCKLAIDGVVGKLELPNVVLPALESLALRHCDLLDADFQMLKQSCAYLRHLSLAALPTSSCKTISWSNGDPALESLSLDRCDYIETLNMNNVETLRSLTVVHCNRLHTILLDPCLNLGSMTITGCTDLTTFSCRSNTLVELDVSCSSNLDDLVLDCPKLQHLNLKSCCRLRPAGLQTMFNNRLLPCLETLNIVNCTQLDVEIIAAQLSGHLNRGLSNIASINVASQSVQDAFAQGLANRQTSTPMFRRLDGGDINATVTITFDNDRLKYSLTLVSPKSLQNIECRASQLERLHLSYIATTLNFEAVITKCSWLEHISLMDYKGFSQSTVISLAQCQHLVSISISQSYVSGRKIKFENFHNLETLRIESCDNKGMQPEQHLTLSTCDRLQHVCLNSSSFSYVSIDLNNLIGLDIGGCRFNSINLFAPRLEHLCDVSTMWRQQPLMTMSVHCVSLHTLSILRSPHLSDVDLHAMLSPCLNLTELSIESCDLVTTIFVPQKVKTLKIIGLHKLTKIETEEYVWKNVHFEATPSLSMGVVQHLLQKVAASLCSLVLKRTAKAPALRLSGFLKLVDVKIDSLSSLSSFTIDSSPKLSNLKVTGCFNLQKLVLFYPEALQYSQSALHRLDSVTSLKISCDGKPRIDLIKHMLPNLKEILLVNVGIISELFLNQLIHGCRSLEKIRLRDCVLDGVGPNSFKLSKHPLLADVEMLVLVIKHAQSQRSFVVHIETEAWVSDLKQRIAIKTGLKPAEVKLVYAGLMLRYSTPLYSLGLKHGSVVHLASRAIDESIATPEVVVEIE